MSQNPDTNFKLLSDKASSPLKKESHQELNQDRYAKVLRKIFLSNPSGICVGLFGRWGRGKSTIINILQEEAKDTKFIIFNAYHSRGDSLRRQLIFSILDTIAPEISNTLKDYTIPIVHSLKEENEQEDCEGKANSTAQKSTFQINRYLLGTLLVTIIIACIFSIISQSFNLTSITSLSSESLWAIPPILLTILMILQADRLKYNEIYLKELAPVLEHERLSLPEQFLRVLDKGWKHYTNPIRPHSAKDILLVIDDLDRCDPQTVVEAFSAVRQLFLDSYIQKKQNRKHLFKLPKLQFLVPCDEEQIALALEADGFKDGDKNAPRYHDYCNKEMLRKFFDAVVRIDESTEETMADFAEEKAKEIGLSKEAETIKNIIDANKIKEPRKIKSIINAFKISLELTIEAKDSKEIIENPLFESTLALYISIQELLPSIHEKIISNPYEKIDNIPDLDKTEDEKLKALLAFFDYSSPVFLYLTTKEYDPLLKDIVDSGKLWLAAEEDNSKKVKEVISHPGNAKKKDQISQWISKKIKRSTSTSRKRRFIGHLIECESLNKWANIQLFNEKLKEIPISQYDDVFNLTSETTLTLLDPKFKKDAKKQKEIVNAIYNSNQKDIIDFEGKEKIGIDDLLQTYPTLSLEGKGLFFLRAFDLLSEENKKSFQALFENGIKIRNNGTIENPYFIEKFKENSEKLKEVPIAHPIHPELGQKLLWGLLNNQVRTEEHQQIQYDISLMLLGSDQERLKEILEADTRNDIPSTQRRLLTILNVAESTYRGPQAKPTEKELENYLYGIEKILSRTTQKEVKELFINKFVSRIGNIPATLLSQESQKRIFKIIKTCFPELEPKTLESALTPAQNTLCPWLTARKETAFDFIETFSDIPDGPNDQVLQQFSEQVILKNLESQLTLTQPPKENIGEILNTLKGWSIEEELEKLLSEKIKANWNSIRDNQEPVSKWINALKPFCTESLQIIEGELKNKIEGADPSIASLFLLQYVWGVSNKSITKEDTYIAASIRGETQQPISEKLVDILIQHPQGLSAIIVTINEQKGSLDINAWIVKQEFFLKETCRILDQLNPKARNSFWEIIKHSMNTRVNVPYPNIAAIINEIQDIEKIPSMITKDSEYAEKLLPLLRGSDSRGA